MYIEWLIIDILKMFDNSKQLNFFNVLEIWKEFYNRLDKMTPQTNLLFLFLEPVKFTLYSKKDPCRFDCVKDLKIGKLS
jgi:hypothetical protein